MAIISLKIKKFKLWYIHNKNLHNKNENIATVCNNMDEFHK